MGGKIQKFSTNPKPRIRRNDSNDGIMRNAGRQLMNAPNLAGVYPIKKPI